MIEILQVFAVFMVHLSHGIQIDINRTNNEGYYCNSEPSCMRCGPRGCLKCPQMIVFSSRRCVAACPFGHQARWSTLHDYMGRMCVPNSNFLGFSGATLTVLTGIIVGALLCLLLIASAIIYVNIRRKEPALLETSSELDDSPERRDFVKQLETLRPYAPHYLQMLNDTRRQLRELHRSGDGGALSAYRPVVRDLAKILLLLNRQVERIAVPDEWEHLFSWAEKALKRYKRMSDVSQPQVAQLISFLQSPLEEEDANIRGSTTMSTFKPSGSTMSLNSVNLNPQWKFEYSLVDQQVSEFDPIAWRGKEAGSLFLDDDFCQLGFRPQDEITTEL